LAHVDLDVFPVRIDSLELRPDPGVLRSHLGESALNEVTGPLNGQPSVVLV
jgi:hypothetical protein